MANMKEKLLQIKKFKKYKMTEREVFKKYDNLSENGQNSKNNKEVYVRNDVITSAIVHYKGEKRGQETKEKQYEFRKKIGFTEFDIMILNEHSIKWKIEKMFANEKVFEKIMSKFMKLIFIFIIIIRKN